MMPGKTKNGGMTLNKSKKVRIVEPEGLYLRYDDEFESQPCYIILDKLDGVLSAKVMTGKNSAPIESLSDRYEVFGIPSMTDEAAVELMKSMAPHAETMLSTDDEDEMYSALEAMRDLTRDTDDLPKVVEVEPAEFFADSTDEELGIATDMDIRAVAKALINEYPYDDNFNELYIDRRALEQYLEERLRNFQEQD